MNPIDLLPIKYPKEYDQSEDDIDYFYNNVIKHLLPDVIRIMNNGIPIDLDKVKELDNVVTDVLLNVESRLASNSLMQDFREFMYPKKFKIFKDELEAKKRDISYYIKPYKDSVLNRTYVVNAYLKLHDRDTIDKATIKVIKELAEEYGSNTLRLIAKGNIPIGLKIAGMRQLAEDKLVIYNKSIDNKIGRVDSEKILPKFNCGSSKQLREFFSWLKIEPIKLTDKGDASWDRASIEEILKTTTNEELKPVLQLFVDHSYSAIIKNNFIESFKKFSIEGTLYGNLKLFGAKTMRLTSNSPNLLNAPSTGSIYAKPLKKCFIAPKGYIVLTADFSSLEDRVIANLSQDANKIAIFEEGLDGHSMATCFYDRDKALSITGLDSGATTKELAIQLSKLVEDGNKEAKAFRQWSKDKTFKLAYGGYPDTDKGGAITQEIFNAYHNEMFTGISKFVDVVRDETYEKGYTHLGLGCRLYSANVDNDIRTLFNANSQFWSILTLLIINKMHTLIDENNLQDDVKCISTIYDSIYFIVKEDADITKWVNDNLITLMKKEVFIGEKVHNDAESEIGHNWSDLVTIPNNASVEDIKEILNGISNGNSGSN